MFVQNSESMNLISLILICKVFISRPLFENHTFENHLRKYFVTNEFMFQDMDNEKEKDLNVFLLHPRDMSVEYKVTKM